MEQTNQMNKTYMITFAVSVLVVFCIGIIAIVLLVPQTQSILEGTAVTYDEITKTEYTYAQTKDIPENTLYKDYTVTSDAMSTFKYTNQYKPGNSDPFYNQAAEAQTENQQTNSTSTSGTSNNASTSNTSQSTTSNTAQQAIDKTTNSNGGLKNPAATSK